MALRVLVVLLFGMGMSPRLVQAANPDHQAEMNAREAFAAGRFDEALEMFAKLYAETLHPVYLRNIGRCHQKMRAPQQAIDSFHDYLAKAKKISPDERAEVEGYIREMEALRTEQAQAAALADKGTGTSPSGGAVAMAPSGTTAAPPPTVVPPATNPPASSGLTLEAKGTTGAASTESAPPLYTRWWLWAGVGAVVAGGIVAAILLSGGTSRPPCTPDIVGCHQ